MKILSLISAISILVVVCGVSEDSTNAEENPKKAMEEGIPARTISRAAYFLQSNPDIATELLTASTDTQAREPQALVRRVPMEAFMGAPGRGGHEALLVLGASEADAEFEYPEELRDFTTFKNTLRSFTIHKNLAGEVFLQETPEERTTPVTKYFAEEDLAMNLLELRVYFSQAREAYRHSKVGGVRASHFQTSFISVDPKGSHTVQTALRAQTEAGKIVRWAPGTVLRFCVLQWTYGSENDKFIEVRDNMLKAVADWEDTCNIQFEHVEVADSSPFGTVFPLDGEGNREVDFVVANFDLGGALAEAFFPNDPVDERLLLVDPEGYFSTTVDKVGILRHEIGHILGFRHEHISPDAPVWTSEFCNLEPSTGSVAVTAFDRASVMHYPCASLLDGGPLDANMKLEITDLDRIGATSIYGKPGEEAPSGEQFRDFQP